MRKYARPERAIDTQSWVAEGLSVNGGAVHELGKDTLELKRCKQTGGGDGSYGLLCASLRNFT